MPNTMLSVEVLSMGNWKLCFINRNSNVGNNNQVEICHYLSYLNNTKTSKAKPRELVSVNRILNTLDFRL